MQSVEYSVLTYIILPLNISYNYNTTHIQIPEGCNYTIVSPSAGYYALDKHTNMLVTCKSKTPVRTTTGILGKVAVTSLGTLFSPYVGLMLAMIFLAQEVSANLVVSATSNGIQLFNNRYPTFSNVRSGKYMMEFSYGNNTEFDYYYDGVNEYADFGSYQIYDIFLGVPKYVVNQTCIPMGAGSFQTFTESKLGCVYWVYQTHTVDHICVVDGTVAEYGNDHYTARLLHHNTTISWKPPPLCNAKRSPCTKCQDILTLAGDSAEVLLPYCNIDPEPESKAACYAVYGILKVGSLFSSDICKTLSFC